MDPDLLVATYAAKQPRDNSLWNGIIEKMLNEIELYLEFVSIARAD